MSYQQENFGMMDEGYFVPRTQILAWLNNLLNLDLSKIQQLGSGAVYCQVIDVIHPGKIALTKVNWKAKNDYQFINNLKILQNSFEKIGIKRHVEVEKLAKAKYQDNLEFIQWLKRYYDVNCGQRGNNYMADERRGNAKHDFGFAEKNVVPKTYNGTGQVLKSQVFQKKKAPKKEEVPMRVKSPTNKKVQIQKAFQLPTQTNTKFENAQISPEELEEKEKLWQQELDYYRQLAKKSEMRIEMISQILKTEDESDMKLKMIEEILKE